MKQLGCGDEMVKELIRNGGFERGNLDFWELILGTANIQSSYKKRGAYAVQLKPSDAGYGIFQTKDKIKVSPFELYRFVSWIKNSTWSQIKAVAYFYDSDYAYISGEDVQLLSKSGAFDWTRFEAFFIVPIEASYMNITFVPWGTSDKVGYIDSVSLIKVPIENISIYTLKLADVYVEDPGTGTWYTPRYFTGIWKQGEYTLFLDYLENAGTGDITLDITIESYDKETGRLYDAVIFDSITISGGNSLNDKVYHKVATAGIGYWQRVKYKLSGTGTPWDLKFKIGVLYKR